MVIWDSRRAQREGGDNVQASYPPYPPPSGVERTSAEAVVKSRLDGLPMPPSARRSEPGSGTNDNPAIDSRPDSNNFDVPAPRNTNGTPASVPTVSTQEPRPARNRACRLLRSFNLRKMYLLTFISLVRCVSRGEALLESILQHQQLACRKSAQYRFRCCPLVLPVSDDQQPAQHSRARCKLSRVSRLSPCPHPGSAR